MTNSKYSYFFIFLALFILITMSFSLHADEPSCADYLELNNSKPEHLTFRSCEKSNDAQLRVLKATYIVVGKYAEQVESELIRRFNMPSIRFVCCGWETIGGSFVHDAYNVSVKMISGETIFSHKKYWPKISTFYVTATLYLDEP